MIKLIRKNSHALSLLLFSATLFIAYIVVGFWGMIFLSAMLILVAILDNIGKQNDN